MLFLKVEQLRVNQNLQTIVSESLLSCLTLMQIRPRVDIPLVDLKPLGDGGPSYHLVAALNYVGDDVHSGHYNVIVLNDRDLR